MNSNTTRRGFAALMLRAGGWLALGNTVRAAEAAEVESGESGAGKTGATGGL